MKHKIETGLFLGRIPFAKFGPGPEHLLIINGGQSFMMKPDAPSLEKDAKRLFRMLPEDTSFVLIGYDPDPAADLSLEGMVADVAEIMRLNHTNPMALMGISYGGVIATRVAARHPERLDKLILVASAHDFSEDGKKRLQKQLELARAGQLAALLGEFATVFRRPWLNLLLRLRLRLGGSRLIERMGKPSSIIRYLELILDNDDTGENLGDIVAKTLVIGGERDQFFGGMMEATTNAIRGARLALFAHETHMVPVERSSDVRSQLQKLL